MITYYVMYNINKKKYLIDYGNHYTSNIEQAEVWPNYEYNRKYLIRQVKDLNREWEEDFPEKKGPIVLKSFNYKPINMKTVK